MLYSSFFEFLFFSFTMSCYGSDGDSSPHVPRKSMLAKEVLSMMRGLTSLNILEKRMKLLKKKKKMYVRK